jgi:pyruvate,water dikinase
MARAAALAARRRRAEAELLARCGAAKWPGAKVILRLARTYVPLREKGKAAFLQAIDAARLAARTVGAEQEAAAAVESADDIFFFTVEEFLGHAAPSRSTIAERRADHERFLGQALPAAWIGPPDPQPLVAFAPVPAGDGPVTGMGVSSGTADGTVRVVSDPALGVDFAAGEILVCEATDPGWASLMFLASALVVDIGGAMSHAAIIARELGVPCVVNTGDGTRRLRTGERVRVDGTTGAVHVLAGGQQQ